MNTEIRQQIVDKIRLKGQILDINLAPYFNQDPYSFHQEIRESTFSDNLVFWGIINGSCEYTQLGTSANPYTNPSLSVIDQLTEACMLSIHDISNLTTIFPSYKNDIEELIQALK